MANKSNFIAATGTYYVMACLSRECIHAACTFGNAPSVDIIASSVDGSKTISIQVKTSSYARTNKGEKLAWFFKYDITKNTSPNHFFIFTDLVGEHCQDKGYWEPTVHIIPSISIAQICQDLGWNDGFFRLQVGKDKLELYKNDWRTLKTELGIDHSFHIWSKE